MKASINTTTGLMIESQSSEANDAALIANAVALGIAASNVEIRTVTDAEHDALISARSEAHLTQTDRFKAIERAFEQHMDAVAQADNWDDRKSCALRAGYAGPWQARGIKFAQWMDQCWAIGIQAQLDVISGKRPMPTPKQAVAELPVMVWPA